jgi:hypothetical protein
VTFDWAIYASVVLALGVALFLHVRKKPDNVIEMKPRRRR